MRLLPLMDVYDLRMEHRGRRLAEGLTCRVLAEFELAPNLPVEATTIFEAAKRRGGASGSFAAPPLRDD